MGVREEGIQVVFDPAFDSGAWPGAAGETGRAFGERWLGASGLLAQLELELGLTRPPIPAWERSYRLCQQLTDRSGYWSQSFSADELGTAERLLKDRDALVMQGWKGQTLSPRLDALWAATSDAPLGLADRLREVVGVLESRKPSLAQVSLATPLETLAPLWRDVFAHLAEHGVVLAERELPSQDASGDLGASQWSSFRPQGDGSLAMLRPYGELAAAEEVAGSLSQLESLEGVLLIGGSATLDEALARHGLPTVGLPGDVAASGHLLQLVVEAAFAPVDPDLLYALVRMDPGPIPRRAGRRFAKALHDMPGRGSAEWKEAWAACEAEDSPEAVARMRTILNPLAKREEAVSVAVLCSRVAALQSWAQTRMSSAPSLVTVAGQCSQLVGLLGEHGEAIRRDNVLELVELLGASASSRAASAGIASVGDPAAVVGPAKHIVWWGFDRGSLKAPHRLRLNAAEKRAMAAHGIEVPSLAVAMQHHATRWQRPMQCASASLTLVCPEVDASGTRNHPHPLWEQIVAGLEVSGDVAKLVVRDLRLPAQAKRSPMKAAPLVAASDVVELDVSLPLREVESPSSLSSLIGCSLQWALSYHAQLRDGLACPPGEPSPLTFGVLAHFVIEEVFKGGARSTEEAAQAAAEIIDEQVELLCESLSLPRYRDRLATVRHAVVESARELGALMTKLGATVAGVEAEVSALFDDVQLSGRIDLLLDSPHTVIDLKWGKATYRDLLKAGAALQLAAYAAAAARDGVAPQVAYFSLRDQSLMAEPGTSMHDAYVPGRTTAAQTWEHARERLRSRISEIANGVLHAPSALREVIKPGIIDGRLVLSPSCSYCSYGAICGQQGEG